MGSKTVFLFALTFSLLFVSPEIRSASAEQSVALPSESPFVDNRNGTVTDKTTGLIWRKCSEGQTWKMIGNSCEGEAAGFSWDDALNHVEILNTTRGFAGSKDWRIPTIKELATLVEYDRQAAIDTRVFPGTPLKWFWSSTPFYRFSNRAWFVAFGYGDISTEHIENQGLHVRLVRGGK